MRPYQIGFPRVLLIVVASLALPMNDVQHSIQPPRCPVLLTYPSVWVSTSRAIAQMNAHSSRAIAAMINFCDLPFAIRRL